MCRWLYSRCLCRYCKTSKKALCVFRVSFFHPPHQPRPMCDLLTETAKPSQTSPHVCVTDHVHLVVRQEHKTAQLMSKLERPTTENERPWVCVHEATTYYLLLPFPSVDAVSFVNRVATGLLFILPKHNGLIGLSCCAPRRDVLTQQCHLSKFLSY